jgi:hypothetical protein
MLRYTELLRVNEESSLRRCAMVRKPCAISSMSIGRQTVGCKIAQAGPDQEETAKLQGEEHSSRAHLGVESNRGGAMAVGFPAF